MFIDITNAHRGNQAKAWVLLLYYHLLREGGVTHDQTAYVDPVAFNAFECMTLSVAGHLANELDQRLIRQGAVIYLLCELNDMVGDYENDYLGQPYTQKILDALASEPARDAVPETAQIVRAVTAPGRLDYALLRTLLNSVFASYVISEFKSLAASQPD